MSIPLISKIKPYNSGSFPVFEDVDGYGGYQVRTTISDRNSIPTLNRKIGMAVYVQADGYIYTLGSPGDNSNWILSSDAIFGDVIGTTVSSSVVALRGKSLDASLASLGSAQDGYILTWVNSASDWQAKPESSSAITLAGDVTGLATSNTVVNITGSGGKIPFNATIIGEQTSSNPVNYGITPLILGSDADHTLSAAELINPILRVTSSVPLTTTRNIILPAITGAIYHIFNGTSGGQSLTFKASAGTGVTVPNGLKSTIYYNGTNYVVVDILIGGDLTATSDIAQTVAKIQGNAVKSGILTSSQDGYVLTWVNTNSDWEAKNPVSGTVRYIPLLSGVFSTNNTLFFNIIGSTEFNLSQFPGAKTIKFQVLLETTGPIATVQLYNYTGVAVVPSTSLSTSNLSTTLLTSADISGSLTNGSAIYQAQIEMAGGGTPSDQVTCTMARLIIQYT